MLEEKWERLRGQIQGYRKKKSKNFTDFLLFAGRVLESQPNGTFLQRCNAAPTPRLMPRCTSQVFGARIMKSRTNRPSREKRSEENGFWADKGSEKDVGAPPVLRKIGRSRKGRMKIILERFPRKAPKKHSRRRRISA